MKRRHILLLALALAGCSITPRSTSLSAEQAAQLARRLANDKAQTSYNCQPFHNGPRAQFQGGHWVWHQRRAHGTADIEATVEFAADGAKPTVSVALLDSSSGRSSFR